MDNEPTSKKRRRRKISPGHSKYSMHDATVAYGAVSSDEVDDGIDPETMNDMVRQKAVTTGTKIDPNEHPTEVELREHNKKEYFKRLGQMSEPSTAYERELRLRLVHRMLLRDIPLHKIAEKLGLGVNQIAKYRREIARRLKDSASNLDVNDLVGDSMGYYKEVQAMSLRTATDPELPVPMQLAALRTSLAAKNDLHRFLQTAGVFDVLRFKPKETSANQDIKTLVEATKAMLYGQEMTEQKEEDDDSEEIQLI